MTIFLVVYVPFMASSAIDRLSGDGWARAWGAAEAALAVAILIGSIGEMRQGWKKKRQSAAAE
ncbi:hypothetical protein AB0C52_08570 [Streptomyces sp. NPDC048717]|uniref:hypothetical protein n=1 Tax=Streptomyces sp. NPDC048717 TaxID=3154928 RepID=UPI00342340ED